jgi:hypothetical protein
MSGFRLAVAALALIACTDAAAQQLVPPPMVPAREIDLTAEIDPFPPSLAWQRAFGNTEVGCVLGIGGERLVAIPVDLDGTPGAPVVAPLPPGSSRAHGYAAVMAANGRLHVAMGVDRPEGGRRLAALYSDDGGRTWSSPTVLGGADTPIGSSFQSALRLVAIDADAAGRVAIAWLPYTDGRVHVAASTDGGTSWSRPLAVSEAALANSLFGNQGIDVAISPATGTIVVATADSTPTYPEGAALRTTRSTDGGLTFSPMRLLEGTPSPSMGPDAVFPDLAVLPDGSLGLAFSELEGYESATGIAQARSTDGGATWTRGARFTFDARSSDALNYGLIDPVVVRERDQALLYWPASAGLTLARWDPASATFVEAQVVSPSVLRPVSAQGYASLSRAGGGAWTLAYLASGQQQETRYRTSVDGGVTWSFPLPFGADAGLQPDARPLVAPLGPTGLLGARAAREVGGDPRVVGTRTALAEPPGGFGVWTLAANDLPDVGASASSAPTLVSDGGNRVVALLPVGDRDGTSIWARVSDDRGINFGSATRVSSFGSTSQYRSGSLQAVATSDGWVWAAYFALRQTGWEMRINVSRDGGRTWLPQDLIPYTTTALHSSSNALRLAAAPGGRAWVAWTNSSDLKLTSTADGGSTFQTVDGDQSTVLSSSSPFLCTAGDRLYLAWRGRRTSVGATRSYLSWSDDGATFAPAVEAAWPGSGNVDLACATDGSATFAWMRSGQSAPYPYRIAVQRHSGSMLGPVVDTGVPSQPSSSLRVDLLATPSGGWLLASEAYATGPEILYELFVATSGAGATSWTAPVLLDDAEPPVRRLHLGVAAAADAAGRSWITWTDNPGIGGGAVFSRRSDDGGSTWAPTVRLDHDDAPWSRGPTTGGPASIVAVDGAAIVGFQRLRAGNANPQALVNADDVLDRDRDGSPATEDCDDANPDLFPGQCGNEPPIARAGDDQVLECTGELSATATLDASASSDPDGEEDLASWVWSENGSTVAEGKVATANFALGAHDVVLTVTDRAGDRGTDDLKVTVQDTVPPTGTITAPSAGLCSATPVTVEASFTDVCDPSLDVAFEPGPGPTYAEHGDRAVTVTATDAGGNAGSASVSFTIDTLAPEVAWLVEPGASITLPATLSMALAFSASDDDGAAGGVVHERIELDGCPIFDGATYGDGDGLLSDESIALDLGTLCRVANACSRSALSAPVLVVKARDCGGNEGSAALSLTGRVALKPGVCGKDGRPATTVRPETKPRIDAPTPTAASPRPSIGRR